MHRPKICFVVAALTFVLGGMAWGGDVASQAVTFDFQAISEIEVTGSPSLSINSAVAGEQPNHALDSSTIYAITTNGMNKKITASIDKAMPGNVTLQIKVAAPSESGVSKGYVILTASAVDVVTGISHVAQTNLLITYKLSAISQAGVIADATRSVTLTLSD